MLVLVDVALPLALFDLAPPFLGNTPRLQGSSGGIHEYLLSSDQKPQLPLSGCQVQSLTPVTDLVVC